VTSKLLLIAFAISLWSAPLGAQDLDAGSPEDAGLVSDVSEETKLCPCDEPGDEPSSSPDSAPDSAPDTRALCPCEESSLAKQTILTKSLYDKTQGMDAEINDILQQVKKLKRLKEAKREIKEAAEERK
jgi:hypothetical protein